MAKSPNLLPPCPPHPLLFCSVPAGVYGSGRIIGGKFEGDFLIAISISVPSTGKVINAAVADHVPVAELIPHLVNPEPGQLWELRRAVGVVAPEQSLAEAGIHAGEALALHCRKPAEPPAPPLEAADELSGDVGTNYAAWIVAAAVVLLAFRAAPLWHPLDFHGASHFGFSDAAAGGGVDLAVLLPLVFSAFAAVAVAAVSLFDRRFVPVAAALGFAAGLNVNVLVGCVVAALLVWRPGPVRVGTIAAAVLAAINFWPPITALAAVVLLIYSGQVALAIAKVVIPRVPAAGVFRDPVANEAGPVVQVHSALVAAACAWLFASVVQLVPWGGPAPSVWTVLLVVALVVAALSARGTRPFHANALAVMAGCSIVWLGHQVPWGVLALVLVALPLVQISSPRVGRIVDALEAVAFCAAVPLALHGAGVFELIRGLG